MPLHAEKVMVWCAISVNRVFGPFFFEESIDQHNYLNMFKDWPKLLRTDSYKKYRFKDGYYIPPHTANLVQKWLIDRMRENFIS